MVKPHLKVAGGDVSDRPQARTPEREALAKAIQTRDEAEERVDAVRQAQETAATARRTARDTLEAAEANVEVAKTRAARHLVDSALGKGGLPPTTVQAARAAVEVAKDDLNAAEVAEAELEKQLVAAEGNLQLAMIRHGEVVRTALAADPAVIALHDEEKKLHARLRVIEAALHCVANPFTPLTGNAVIALHNEQKIAPDWADAVEALTSNADTALPE